MFCAGKRDGVGACNGDSGGGMFFNYDGTWYIRGLVSFTKPREDAHICDTKEYTAFTDVAKYLKWIEQHMRGPVGQQNVAENYNNLKIGLLPKSTCGTNPLSIRLGEYDRSTITDCAEVDGQRVCSPPVQTLEIESVIRHKDYNSMFHLNNIALIRLRERADTSRSNIKPICLPVTNELRNQKSTHYTLTAWNRDILPGRDDYVLQRSLRDLVELKVCQRLYMNHHFNVTADQLCVKQQHGPNCTLPMGGAPLQLVQQVQEQSRYVLYGVVSHGPIQCRNTGPDISLNIVRFVDWILENIQE
uniref:Peptidase S1 domain-containing protein n=1 Tax=Anopheles culicifacies TaxID=139723 RepID=A0A182LSL4_9DIPT